MNTNSLQPNEIEPLNLFIMGGAGMGKRSPLTPVMAKRQRWNSEREAKMADKQAITTP